MSPPKKAFHIFEDHAIMTGDMLPLLRIKNEVSRVRHGRFNVTVGEWNYVAPNMFAGSIFDLEPDTEYECRFVMSDPDGVTGDGGKTVTVRTRPEPKPYHIRNIAYNNWTGSVKWNFSQGAIYYHNTFCSRVAALTSGGSGNGSNFHFGDAGVAFTRGTWKTQSAAPAQQLRCQLPEG